MSRISRRAFHGCIASGLVLLPGRTARADMSYRYTAHGFNRTEEALVHRAMGQARMMTSEKVIRNYIGMHTGQFYHRNEVFERTKTHRSSNQRWHKKATFLEFQVTTLNFGEAEIPIEIHAFNEKNDTWGRADIGTVTMTVNEDGKGWTGGGKFIVDLNTHKMNRDVRNGDNPTTWGAVIVHEMLHNLGHLHDVDDYEDSSPINLFENCVGYQGRYRKGLPRHFTGACGGRRPG